MTEERIGKVVHYWPKVHAAQISLDGAVLRKGDRIRIRGHGHDFVETVDTLEVEHRPRGEGRPDDELAVGVTEPVHEGDEVWRIEQSDEGSG